LTATELAYFRETDSDVINDLGRDCFITQPVDNKDIKDKVKAILSKGTISDFSCRKITMLFLCNATMSSRIH
jgi:hypothetical protein